MTVETTGRSPGRRTAAPIVIVGGGLAGLAAAVLLSGEEHRVLVLEQKPFPGGRTYSFIDAETGDTVDNGQHALIRGYGQTFEFLKTIGTHALLAVQDYPELTLHHPKRGFGRFHIPYLRPPLNLAAAILSFRLLTWKDRRRLLSAGRRLRSTSSRDDDALATLTVKQWLDMQNQPEEVQRVFWEPLAVSIMNEQSNVASAQLFIRSLRTAFLSDWNSAALALPSVGLGDLLIEPAVDYLAKHGGELWCSTEVTRVVVEDGIVTGVTLKNGEMLPASAVIVAVPPTRAVALLPAQIPENAALARFQTAPLSPIVSIYLWFPRDFMQRDAVGLIGRHIQWIFNRSKMTHPGGGLISAVISAAHEFVDRTNKELVDVAVADLVSVFGAAVGEPSHALVIREKRATFSASPSVEPLRPGSATSLPNLFLAGDWTATGYPATIEGAVLSGNRAGALADAWLRRIAFQGQIADIR